MGRINLVIADKDEEYSASLAESLLQSYGNIYDIAVYSTVEALRGALAVKETPCDVLLVDETVYACIACGIKEKAVSPYAVILLSEDSKPESPGTVFKYRHISRISRDIMDEYFKQGGKKTFPSYGETQTRLIGITSASGGAGKSTFSACISIQCAIRRHTALLVSFEEIPSTTYFFEEDGNKNLSHIFYRIKNGGQDVPSAIESCAAMTGIDGLYFIPAPENPLEYGEISAEELSGMLRDMRNLGKYDYIFLDMQSGYSQKTEISKKQCDLVFMLVEDSALSSVKIKAVNKAMNDAKNRGETDVRDKTIAILCSNRSAYSAFENMEFNGTYIADRLPFEPGFLINTGTGQFTNPSNQYVSAVAGIFQKFVASTGKNAKQDEKI